MKSYDARSKKHLVTDNTELKNSSSVHLENYVPSKMNHIETWLQNNKMRDLCVAFKKKNITIEQIIHHDDMDQFYAMYDLKLDVLQKKRLIAAIRKTKPQHRSIKHHRVIVSTEEDESLNKLYVKFDECSKAQVLIQNALNISHQNTDNLNHCYLQSIHQINIAFDQIMTQIVNKRDELLNHINVMERNKQQLLQQQLHVLQNEYIPMLQRGSKAMDDIPFATTVAATTPRIEFNTENALVLLDAFMKTLRFDDYDAPLPPKMKITKVEGDSITIRYDIQKQYYLSIRKPILKVNIQWALVKHDVDIWNDYKQPEAVDSSHADSSDSSSDEEGDAIHTKRKRKTKRRKHIKAKAKIRLMETASYDQYDELKWMNMEYKITKKRKRYDKYCTIEEDVKSGKTYMIRMKLLNGSGWSEYSADAYAVKMPKTASKILTKKEMKKLKRMVPQHLRKWKLLLRASRDGYNGHSFHRLTDNKRNTVCVVQTNSNNVFGGYVSIPWQTQNASYGADPQAFVFLLRSSAGHKAQRFDIQHSTYAYLYNPTMGCIFGAGDIYLQTQFNTGMNSYTNKHAYQLPTPHYLNGEQRTFNVKEFEVFQLK
eukprot:152039_1